MKLLIPLLAISATNALFAANPISVLQLSNQKEWSFVENKGQLIGEDHKTLTDVKYYSQSGSVHIYCQQGMVSFVFVRMEDKNGNKSSEASGQPVLGVGVQNFKPLHQEQFSNTKMTTARMDLVLINSNQSATITASEQQEYYENFYTTGDANHGISNVHTFKKVTYEDIYPHIDMVLNPEGQGMEYSFLVHPGGNVEDIRIKWNGTDNKKALKSGGFKFCNDLGSMEESAPLSFAGGNVVASSFMKRDVGYGFKVGSYDRGKNILIDPKLVWAITFGGGGIEQGLGVSADRSGNVYMTGIANSSTGIATTGAYQTSFGGNQDAFLAKFNNFGTKLWVTYYGGSNYDFGQAVSTDASGNIYITGFTVSNGLSTSGAYQTSNKGYYNAFLAKFTSSGGISWATYYGGGPSSYDEAFGVCTDGSGNVYIGGSTTSAGIATSGAYKTSYTGGSAGNAFLAKFSSSGSLSWSTYYGGSAGDAVRGVNTDTFGNVYIVGSTVSSTGIATFGAYQTSYAGGANYGGDAFLAKFAGSGNLVWATYYGGSDEDYGQGVSTDGTGNIFITGFTASSNGIATSGAFQTSYNSGDLDAFLAKFSSSGSLSWATYYGGNVDDRGYGVSTDPSGNAYVGGWTNSSGSLATTGAYQTSNAGYEDAFLATFSPSGKLSWATYYGGSLDDYGQAVSTDIYGNAYIAGSTINNAASQENAFLAKFSFLNQNDAGITSIKNPKGVFCTGNKSVQVSLKNFGTSVLDSVKILWSVNSKVQKPYSWYGKLNPDSLTSVNLGSFSLTAGYDTIRAWTSEPNGISDSVPANDSAKIIDTVNAAPSPNAGGNHAICNGDNITMGASATNGHTYSWTSNPAGFTSNVSNPTATPLASTTYYLLEKITSTGCSAIDSATIIVNPLPSATAGINQAACVGASVSIGSTSINGHSYSWISKPSGFSATVSNPTVTPINSTTYYLKETIVATGCSKTDSVSITLNPIPDAIAGSAQSICVGQTTAIGFNSISGHTYSWSSNPTGFISSISNPTITPTITTTYYLTETIALTGCQKSDSVKITVNPQPNARVGSSQTICSGDSAKIGANPVPGDKYSWVSSPAGFTSILSNPYVTPKSTSTYTLTETIGSCTKTDSVKITVNPSPDAGWTSTNFTKNYAFKVKDSSLAKSFFVWDFGDGTGTFTGYSVNHIFPTNKTFSVKLTVTNTNGCLSVHDSTMIISTSGITSDVNTDLYNLRIFPNPFQNKATLNFTLPQSARVKISLMDIAGRIIYFPADNTFNPGPNQITINASEAGLSPGTYYLNIMINDLFITKKIIEVR